MTGARPRADVDVLVAGGGPIGLAVAIEARIAGHSVLVVEPRATPIDKACGEGLMPGAVAALARLGVRPDGHALTGITYVDGERSADHAFTGGHGLGVRRTSLHVALADRAAELGVGSRHAKVDAVEQDPDGVTAAGIRARWLMACDGLHSTIRRECGLEKPLPRQGQRRFGIRRHLRMAPWTDRVEVHWGTHAEVYVTPIAPDAVGVAVLGSPPIDFDACLAEFPALRDRLAGSEVMGPTLGAGPMLQRTTARTLGRVRLVGDAGGYVDALTGEGIRVGLAQAAAAVGTLEDDPSRSAVAYERQWTRVTRDYRRVTSGLLLAARSPLRRGIVPASAALPRVYGRVVELIAA